MNEHVFKNLDIERMADNPKYPRVISVIISVVERGTGVDESPIRGVIQYHDLDGQFLAEYDVHTDHMKNGIRVGEYCSHLEQRE